MKNDNDQINRFHTEEIEVIETNLDDLSPQAIAFVMERLFETGALDVTIVPAVMKKGRPGHTISVLSKLTDAFAIKELLLTETSTLGVRSHRATRLLAERTWEEVILSNGSTIRIKIAKDKTGTIINSQPEFEDCASAATKHNVPLKNIYNEAIAEFARKNKQPSPSLPKI